MHNVFGVETKDERKQVVVPPPGGDVRRKNFDFTPALKWTEAVMYGVPQTGHDWNVLDVGRHFPPQNGVRMRASLILVNFGRSLPSDAQALDWAKNYRIRPAHPRKILALAQSESRLDRLLGSTPLAVASLQKVEFKELERTICVVWNSAGARQAYLTIPEVSCEDWFWFAFEND